jgi:hypothetical protein
LVVPAIRALLNVVAATVNSPLSWALCAVEPKPTTALRYRASRPIVRVAGFCLLHDQVNEGPDPDIFARRSA